LGINGELSDIGSVENTAGQGGGIIRPILFGFQVAKT